MARVNEVLREVLAEEIEVLASTDARLELVTVTAVSCEPDLRHATVLLASLPDTVREALGEVRPRLQTAIAHQVRMKRTPQLSFQVDPAVGHGELVEEILRELRSSGELREGSSAEPAPVEEAEDLGGGPASPSGDEAEAGAGAGGEAGGAAGTSAEPAV
jgi:ribosome-binding factor A